MSDQQQQQQNKDLEDPRILEVCVVVPCPAEGLVKSSKLKRISHPHALRRILSQIVDWLRHTLMREDVTFEVRHTCVVEHPLTGVRTNCFQVNATSLDKLYSVMKQSQARVADAQNVIAAQEEARMEYSLEGERVQKILAQFGMSTDSLSQSGLTSLRTLSEVGNILGLNDTRSGTYFTALHDLQKDTDETSQRLRRQEQQRMQMQAQLDEIMGRRENLAHQRAAFEATEEENSMKSDSHFAQYQPNGSIPVMRQRYSEAVKANRLKVGKLDKDIEHQALVKLGLSVEKLMADIGPLDLTLKGFQDLPPDATMASVKLEQSKMNLGRLREELAGLTEGEAALLRGR